jgi:hydrogenase maturation protease
LKKVAVVGVGNILMGDEGAGIEVIRELEKRVRNVEIIDAGTAFFALVSDMHRFDKLIVVDVARGGKEPGTVYRFTLEDVRGTRSAISLHDIGVVEALKLESLTGRIPDEVVFYGIEPLSIEFTIGLSSVVQEKISYTAEAIVMELAGDGIPTG